MIVLTDSEDELFTQIAKEDDTLLKTSDDQNGTKKKDKIDWKNMETSKEETILAAYFSFCGTEFCERFSYYGMGAILILYLTKWLKFEADRATAIFHTFAMLCYFSPLMGAVLADGYIGKYRTILYPSIVYLIGNLIMSVTALPPPEWFGPMIGLLLIAFGTGGIKPCVGAFGADQFGQGQEKERDSFFSAFYFMINLGSLFSTLLTPVLRADVKCFGGNCYPLAFGVPAILMFVSVVLFVSGRKMYIKNPPSGNLFGRMARCIYLGIYGKVRGKINKRHWLDYAVVQFEQEFIDEIKDVLKILAMFIPLPVFWALAHQQGSRWTLQAEQMDGDMGVFGTLKPDQMQALNPLLIIFLIPVFEKFIYPTCDKYKFMNRPLKRMVTGLFLSSISFVIAALVQIELEKQKDISLSIGQSGVTIINSIPCPVDIKSSIYNKTVQSYHDSGYIEINSGRQTVKISSSKCVTNSSLFYQFTNQKSYRLFLAAKNKTLIYCMTEDVRKKPKEGQSYLSIYSNIETTLIQLKLVANGYNKQPIKSNTGINVDLYYNVTTNFTSIDPGRYDVYYKEGNSSVWIAIKPELTIGFEAVYTLLVFKEKSPRNEFTIKLFTSVAENSLSMLWLVPQYVVITVGEILFSITGLSLAYSQAPKSMKSVVQAAWLMTSAVGDLIVVIVAEGSFIPSQVGEFFFFAALMAVDSFIFIIMSYFYTYQDYSSVIESESSDYEDTTKLINNTRDIEHIPLQENSHEHHLRNRT